MISLDPYLEEFIQGNWKTLSVFFGILIGLAKASPWKWDEKVLDIITAPFRTFFEKLGSNNNSEVYHDGKRIGPKPK